VSTYLNIVDNSVFKTVHKSVVLLVENNAASKTNESFFYMLIHVRLTTTVKTEDINKIAIQCSYLLLPRSGQKIRLNEHFV